MNILILGIENELGALITQYAHQKNIDIWAVTSDRSIQLDHQFENIHIINDDISVNGPWKNQLPEQIDAIFYTLMPEQTRGLIYHADANRMFMLNTMHQIISIIDRHPESHVYTFLPAHIFETSSMHSISETATMATDLISVNSIYTDTYRLINAKKDQRISILIYGIIYSKEGKYYPFNIPQIRRFPIISGSGENTLALLHLDDAARIALLCFENKVTEKIIACSDDLPVEQKHFIESYAYTHNLMPSIPIPEIIAQRMYPYASPTWSRSMKLDNTKMKKLGIYLKFPHYKAGLGLG